MKYNIDVVIGPDFRPVQWCYEITDESRKTEVKCGFGSPREAEIAARARIADILGNTDLLDNIEC